MDVPRNFRMLSHKRHNFRKKLLNIKCLFWFSVQLYGEVNSVKNTTVNIWLNDGVISNIKKLHVSTYSVL